MDAEMQRRLRWVELFFKIKNYGVVCLRCGMSRPTLRKWVRQFQENGMDGLRAASKRPKSSPAAKVADKHREWIRELRKRGLGSRRIPLLASHIVLAVLAPPVVLVTFFFSLTGRFPQHRKLARWTFPLWLCVSVTGVITYVMLRLAE